LILNIDVSPWIQSVAQPYQLARLPDKRTPSRERYRQCLPWALAPVAASHPCVLERGVALGYAEGKYLPRIPNPSNGW